MTPTERNQNLTPEEEAVDEPEDLDDEIDDTLPGDLWFTVPITTAVAAPLPDRARNPEHIGDSIPVPLHRRDQRRGKAIVATGRRPDATNLKGRRPSPTPRPAPAAAPRQIAWLVTGSDESVPRPPT